VIIFFYSYWGDTESLVTAATTVLLYELRMIGDSDCGEIGAMKIGRGNRSTLEKKPSPVPLCPPQTPTCCPDVNSGAAVESQRLTA
jgi:hypothetical protein